MSNFKFAQFDPRPVGREVNDGIIAAAHGGITLLGIEVTIHQLAESCVFGNLDHHGPNDTAETPSAAEQALVCELPPKGATLVTVRTDTDSVSAMAILANRAEGLAVDAELVAAIGRFDRLGPASGAVIDEVIAIGRVSADSKRTLEQRVAWIQSVLAGEGDVTELTELVAARNREFDEARAASELTLHADGRIALVVSTHRFATNLGYEKASVLVAYNPAMPVDFKDPSKGTYRKFTICRYDSHVAVDLMAVMNELNELDPAVSEGARWGGRGDIIGSPQGVSSELDAQKVLAVVTSHLK